MKIIITGSTGMVGRGALLEAIENPAVSQILIINRTNLGIDNPKVKEVLLSDFSEISTIAAELKGYDACLHCMGVSAFKLSEEQYTHITYELTKSLADMLYEINPQMVFCYVSGLGTDSSEKGSVMWARVKGRTENYILNRGFADAYAFRPGGILPEKGIKSRTSWYNTAYIISRPFFPLLKKMKSITTTTKLGKALINIIKHPQESKHLENEVINQIAQL